ncbi:hypothetical protein D7Z54_16555 [Salibacterium salarium]|uniref:VanW like protein n=1 Tax=Salibacterium salarium TaxID=284579 RepID=A0A428N1D6_9BACI|nr:VanW family protein [Salibacterium salarium]RSL32261.1 hypothetical protein D7Z54_16555 [Salibacterium salarium]
MKRNYYIEKSFILLTLTAFFIFLFSWGGSVAIEAAWTSEERLPEGTVVGGVDVGGLLESEANEILTEESESWKNSSGTALSLFNEEVIFDSKVINIDVTKSIDLALEKESIPLQATINQSAVENHLERFSFANLSKRVSMTDLKNRLTVISNITESDYEQVDVADYFDEDHALQAETFNQVTITRNEPFPSYFQEWVGALDGYETPPHTTFSLTQALEESDVSYFDDPSLDVLASAFFQVMGQTNFVLSERHINESLPSYIELGQDAHVEPEKEDLRFYNPNIYAYEWNLEVERNQLTVSLQGLPFLHDYSMGTREEETMEPRTIVTFNSSRSSGEKETLTDGEVGHFADVIRQVKNDEDVVIEKTELAQDYYAPVQRLEEWSLQDRAAMDDKIPEQVWEENDNEPTESEDEMNDVDETEEELEESENDTTVTEGKAKKEENSETEDTLEDTDDDTPVKGYD